MPHLRKAQVIKILLEIRKVANFIVDSEVVKIEGVWIQLNIKTEQI